MADGALLISFCSSEGCVGIAVLEVGGWMLEVGAELVMRDAKSPRSESAVPEKAEDGSWALHS